MACQYRQAELGKPEWPAEMSELKGKKLQLGKWLTSSGPGLKMVSLVSYTVLTRLIAPLNGDETQSQRLAGSRMAGKRI